jgi:cellulose synthase/poly-beta-1,6-N-acetylglucosamine synthase-like glycosyltransferase
MQWLQKLSNNNSTRTKPRVNGYAQRRPKSMTVSLTMKSKMVIGGNWGNIATFKPKVTIGICGKNCAGLVGPALESVAKQDFPHKLMEIVFVDGGSTDTTLKVVQNHLSQMDIVS